MLCILLFNKKEKLKTLMSLALSVILLFTVTSPSLAMSNASNELSLNVDGYQTSLVINTKEYQKIEIRNSKTGEMEFLEAFLQKDGSYNYVASKGGKKDTFINNNNNIIVVHDNGVVENLSRKNETVLILNENIKDVSNDMDALSLSRSISIPNSYWSTYESGRSSLSTQINDFAYSLGLIVTVMSIPFAALTGAAASIVTATVATIVSKNMDEIYYSYIHQNRVRDGWIELRRFITIYTNSDYDEFINTIITPAQKYRKI